MSEGKGTEQNIISPPSIVTYSLNRNDNSNRSRSSGSGSSGSSINVLHELAGFINKVDSRIDIISSANSLLMLERWKAFDLLISEKLYKNIRVRLMCPFDDTVRYTIKRIAPFFDCKSIDAASISKIDYVLFVRDYAEVLIIDFEKSKEGKEDSEELYNPVLSRFNSSNSNVSLVKVIQSSFDSLWNQTENNEKLQEEKIHSDLLFDVLTHDLGNHCQILNASLELAHFNLDEIIDTSSKKTTTIAMMRIFLKSIKVTLLQSSKR